MSKAKILEYVWLRIYFKGFYNNERLAIVNNHIIKKTIKRVEESKNTKSIGYEILPKL
jgi:hypothetical protein